MNDRSRIRRSSAIPIIKPPNKTKTPNQKNMHILYITIIKQYYYNIIYNSIVKIHIKL